MFTTRPDNPLTETGIRAEWTHHGIGSRTGTRRVDTRHQPADALVVGAPWILAAAGAAVVIRVVARRHRRLNRWSLGSPGRSR
jgi:hypothetical protein